MLLLLLLMLLLLLWNLFLVCRSVCLRKLNSDLLYLEVCMWFWEHTMKLRA